MAESKKTKKNIKKEEFNIRELYTPLSVAKKEIWRRWNDKELRKKSDNFFGETTKASRLNRSIVF